MLNHVKIILDHIINHVKFMLTSYEKAEILLNRSTKTMEIEKNDKYMYEGEEGRQK